MKNWKYLPRYLLKSLGVRDKSMRRIEAFDKASLKLALQILMVMSLILGMALPTAQAEEARTVRVGYFYLTG